MPKVRRHGTLTRQPDQRARWDIQGLRAFAVLAVIGNHLFGWPEYAEHIAPVLLEQLSAQGILRLRR